MRQEYKNIIESEALKIDSALKNCRYLSRSGDSAWESVLEAESYALSAGGKRIRPVLAIEFYKMFSGAEPDRDIYDAVCALEMTHTFSLIHDDMPEMDDDGMRRGKPATHVVYGNAMGLLSGDGLAILPYEILSSLAIENKISETAAVRLINILSSCAGNRGMIAGQVLDLWSESHPEKTDLDFLVKMSNLKTGCMLRASCMFGAVLGGAPESCLENVGKYAENVGLAFQIVDDVLDVTSDPDTLGKPIGSDRERKKPTFADILGIDGALKEAARLSRQAAEALSGYDGSELLREFAVSLSERKK